MFRGAFFYLLVSGPGAAGFFGKPIAYPSPSRKRGKRPQRQLSKPGDRMKLGLLVIAALLIAPPTYAAEATDVLMCPDPVEDWQVCLRWTQPADAEFIEITRGDINGPRDLVESFAVGQAVGLRMTWYDFEPVLDQRVLCFSGVSVDFDGSRSAPSLDVCKPLNPPSVQPQCNDGLDNDLDGETDFPEDDGCTDLLDDDETDPPPPPEPQCNDGLDNDGDNETDFPQDDGCTSSTDDDETDPPTGTPPSQAVVEVNVSSDVEIRWVGDAVEVDCGGTVQPVSASPTSFDFEDVETGLGLAFRRSPRYTCTVNDGLGNDATSNEFTCANATQCKDDF